MAAVFRNRRSAGLALWLVVGAVSVWTMHEPAGAQGRKTVWEKVYTSDQAALGKTEYDMVCAGCHGNDLSGRDGGGQGPELCRPRLQEEVGPAERQPAVHRDQDAHAAQPARYAHRRRLPERRGLRPRVEQVPRRRRSARRQCGAGEHVHHASRNHEGCGGSGGHRDGRSGTGDRLPAEQRRRLDADTGGTAGPHREPRRVAGRTAGQAGLNAGGHRKPAPDSAFTRPPTSTRDTAWRRRGSWSRIRTAIA